MFWQEDAMLIWIILKESSNERMFSYKKNELLSREELPVRDKAPSNMESAHFLQLRLIKSDKFIPESYSAKNIIIKNNWQVEKKRKNNSSVLAHSLWKMK